MKREIRMAFTRDSFIDPFNDSIQGLCKWRKIESILEMDSSYREYPLLDLQIFSSIKGGKEERRGEVTLNVASRTSSS